MGPTNEPERFNQFNATTPPPAQRRAHREAKTDSNGPHRLRVSFVDGERAAGASLVFNQDLITIGRGAECDIVLEGETISRQHCLIARCAAGYALQDSSRNGTFLNDARAERSPLNDGDRIKIGPYLIQVAFAAAAVATQAFAGKATRPDPPSASVPCIIVTGSTTDWQPDAPQAFEEEVITVGRAADNHVAIVADNISRRHLAIERRAVGYFARDLGSSNGTRLNERKIDAARLRDGDVLRIGDLQLTVSLQDDNCQVRITEAARRN